jgi:hypothetical protein
MSSFECKVSELNGNTESNVLKDTSSVTGINKSSFETNTTTNTNTNPDKATATNTNTNTNTTTPISIDKFFNEKNLKTVLLIAVVYFFLHSEQVLEFIIARLPSLGSNIALNSVGKIIYGLLIGICFIVYSFFFQGP